MELAYKARIATFKDIQSIVDILKPILNQKGIGGELKRHLKELIMELVWLGYWSLEERLWDFWL